VTKKTTKTTKITKTTTKTTKTTNATNATKRGAAKTAAKSPAAKPAPRSAASASPRLLAGGNPQIAKADGNAPVQAYIAAMPGWKRAAGRSLDAIITRAVPGVRKAVKWNSPMYGVDGGGWFTGVHCCTKYIKVAFFDGSSLTSPPPIGSKRAETRYLHIVEGDLVDGELRDGAQIARWMQEASKLPGWGKAS
jgi:hypothetical protein